MTTLEEVFLKVGNGIEEEVAAKPTGEDLEDELTDEEEKNKIELDEFDNYTVANNKGGFSVDTI